MMHDAWCMLIHSYTNTLIAWCIVHGAWCMVYTIHYTVHGTWYMVHGTWYMVHGGTCAA